MELVEALQQGADRFIEQLKKRQIDLGKKASGASAKSLEVRNVSQHGFEIHGFDYFQRQETGTGPFDVRDISLPDFSKIIEKWARDKNIEVNPFSVARSIKFKGDQLFRGINKPLGGPQLFNRFGDELLQQIDKAYQADFTSTLIRNTRTRT